MVVIINFFFSLDFYEINQDVCDYYGRNIKERLSQFNSLYMVKVRIREDKRFFLDYLVSNDRRGIFFLCVVEIQIFRSKLME